VATERVERMFAPGERIMFLHNERALGVKNGTLDTLERIDSQGLTVRLDSAGGPRGSGRREGESLSRWATTRISITATRRRSTRRRR
jgi:ATP-dependent exoDNAse (exonuclease V) alpha subunit